MATGKCRRRVERGQATVELALVLPLAVIFALVVVQLGVVAKDLVLVGHAAREGARAAAVDPTVASARAAVVSSSSLAADRLSVSLSGGTGPGDATTVEVRYRAPTTVPLVGALLPDVSLRASVTMRVE
jgi:Flp pilus assembly protein TadG